jgi:hypothetical protein
MNNLSMLLETQVKFKKLLELTNSVSRFSDPLSKMLASENQLTKQFKAFEMPSALNELLQKQKIVEKFSLGMTKTFSVFDQLKKLTDALHSNPELEFISISDLEIMSATSTSELVDSLEEDVPMNLFSKKKNYLMNFWFRIWNVLNSIIYGLGQITP